MLSSTTYEIIFYIYDNYKRYNRQNQINSNIFWKKESKERHLDPIKLEWDNDNVSKMSIAKTIEGIEIGTIMEFKYDDKINPFKNYLSLYPEESSCIEFSKNNATEIKYTEYIDTLSSSDTEFITYTYDGKYPVTRNSNSGLDYFEYE